VVARTATTIEQHDDPTLLAAWRAGDSQAGSLLVQRHFGAVFRFFRRRFDDTELATDLTQRALTTCVQVQDSLQDGIRFRAFVLGIARNVLLRHLRAAARHREDPRSRSDAPCSRTSPSGVAAGREEQRRLAAALRRLPLPMQLALELHYWEGLTTAEIAEVLGVAAGTIKWRLSRARDRLRDELQRMATSEVADMTSRGLDRWASSMRRRAAV
jgi:RNA polymerase sigma-70 factor (ECF subfamily)